MYKAVTRTSVVWLWSVCFYSWLYIADEEEGWRVLVYYRVRVVDEGERGKHDIILYTVMFL